MVVALAGQAFPEGDPGLAALGCPGHDPVVGPVRARPDKHVGVQAEAQQDAAEQVRVVFVVPSALSQGCY